MSDDGFSFDPEDDLIDDEMRERIEEETFFLSPGRLYIVFDPQGFDKVNVRAYDTSDTKDVSAAHILQQGMLSLLETDYDYLMQLGHEATLERIVEKSKEKEDNNKLIVEDVYDNIIKVKFSEDN
jgi:hypothetical protein|tara:strand:- start:1239 stop:1613 length:375 start_codon:yes stop_codon:yes gene_type:complete